MSYFVPFEDFDEVMEFMRAQERAANALVTPEQASIGYGDYWKRVVADYDDLAIYGYVPTPAEVEAIERGLGAEDEELAEELAMLADAHERGYRYGRAYSVVEPDGEWGSTHISTMTKITAEAFEAAREAGWQ